MEAARRLVIIETKHCEKVGVTKGEFKTLVTHLLRGVKDRRQLTCTLAHSTFSVTTHAMHNNKVTMNNGLHHT